MKVVTCISDAEDYGFMHLLKDSCEHFDLPLVVLEHREKWTSHRNKDAHLVRYLEDLPKHEVVLFTDGYDAIFMCSESEIMAKHHAADRALILSAEKNCWPYAEHPPAPTRFRHLNCGGFVGEAGLIAERLTPHREVPASPNSVEVDYEYRWSDQYYWMRVYLLHRDLIALDHQAEMFLELGSDAQELFPTLKDLHQTWPEEEKSKLYARERERLRRACLFVDGRVLHRDTRKMAWQIHFKGTVVKKIAFDNRAGDALAEARTSNVIAWMDRPIVGGQAIANRHGSGARPCA